MLNSIPYVLSRGGKKWWLFLCFCVAGRPWFWPASPTPFLSLRSWFSEEQICQLWIHKATMWHTTLSSWATLRSKLPLLLPWADNRSQVRVMQRHAHGECRKDALRQQKRTSSRHQILWAYSCLVHTHTYLICDLRKLHYLVYFPIPL